jgi:hypothetical protein
MWCWLDLQQNLFSSPQVLLPLFFAAVSAGYLGAPAIATYAAAPVATSYANTYKVSVKAPVLAAAAPVAYAAPLTYAAPAVAAPIAYGAPTLFHWMKRHCICVALWRCSTKYLNKQYKAILLFSSFTYLKESPVPHSLAYLLVLGRCLLRILTRAIVAKTFSSCSSVPPWFETCHHYFRSNHFQFIPLEPSGNYTYRLL